MRACVCVCVCGCRHRWACVYGGLCSFFPLFFFEPLTLRTGAYNAHCQSRQHHTYHLISPKARVHTSLVPSLTRFVHTRLEEPHAHTRKQKKKSPHKKKIQKTIQKKHNDPKQKKSTKKSLNCERTLKSQEKLRSRRRFHLTSSQQQISTLSACHSRRARSGERNATLERSRPHLIFRLGLISQHEHHSPVV